MHEEVTKVMCCECQQELLLQKVAKQKKAKEGYEAAIYQEALLSRGHGVGAKPILHVLLKSCQCLCLILE